MTRESPTITVAFSLPSTAVIQVGGLATAPVQRRRVSAVRCNRLLASP